MHSSPMITIIIKLRTLGINVRSYPVVMENNKLPAIARPSLREISTIFSAAVDFSLYNMLNYSVDKGTSGFVKEGSA